MSRRGIVTIVTRNYLAYAKALMRQCERHEPRVDRFVVIVDRLPEGATADGLDAQVMFGDELGIDRWQRYSFQYTPFELVCALKPHAIECLMTRWGYQEVVYLDSDMGLYGPLSPAWKALENDSIVLTPHLLRPLPEDGLRPHESLFTSAGAFNAGFFGVRDTSVGRSCLSWWKSMLRKHCIVDQPAGLFVDQRWLCLVPGMFSDVRVLRHAGMNAGHWTLSQATLEEGSTGEISTSGVSVSGEPLVLFHFSGMTPHDPAGYLRHENRVRIDEIPCLKSLVDRFHGDVLSEGLSECVPWGCQMDRLSDGTPIKAAWREAIRREEPAFADVVNPFDVASQSNVPSRYRAIEAVAHDWRTDWRMEWERKQVVPERFRRLGYRFRNMVQALTRSFDGTDR
jgi:hypothetical protein